MEGDGTSEAGDKFTAEIKSAADSLDADALFHLVVDILGFVLFMHQQIPSVLQDMSLQFDSLQTECKELMTQSQTERNASQRRLLSGRMREAKFVIKKMEKLMKTISSFRAALQLLISEIPDVQEFMLILGSNPARPLYVYKLCFSHGKIVSRGSGDFTRTKAAETLSRKAIRSLISAGAGSTAYAGPSKLFLLVKAPSSLNLPMHFLPKRDFRYHKKVGPFRLRFKCRTKDQELGSQNFVAQTTDAISLNSQSDDQIWFQCRHIVKGIPSKTSIVED